MFPTVLIVADDGFGWDLHPDITKYCKFITDIIDDLGLENLKNTPIRVTGIDSSILDKIMDWGFYHARDAPFEADEWDEQFLNVDPSTFERIFSAAKVLKVKHLLDLCHAKKELDSKPEQARSRGEFLKLFNYKNRQSRLFNSYKRLLSKRLWNS